jgi:hypothetical protein
MRHRTTGTASHELDCFQQREEGSSAARPASTDDRSGVGESSDGNTSLAEQIFKGYSSSVTRPWRGGEVAAFACAWPAE